MSEDSLEAITERQAKAIALLEEALSILDAIDAPGLVGAHVDFAISRLRRQGAFLANAWRSPRSF